MTNKGSKARPHQSNEGIEHGLEVPRVLLALGSSQESHLVDGPHVTLEHHHALEVEYLFECTYRQMKFTRKCEIYRQGLEISSSTNRLIIFLLTT